MSDDSRPPFLLPVLRPPGPGFSDWLFLAIGVLFVLAGAWLCLSGRSPGTGLMTLAFFGLCTAVAVWQIREKLGHRKFDETRQVQVAGGERIPMRKDRMVGLASAILGVGGVGAVFGGAIGPFFVVLNALVAAFGTFLLVQIARGRAASDWLAFEPDGLRLGNRRWTCLVHWDNVAHLSPSDVGGNPIAAIVLRDRERLLAGVDPPAGRERVAKLLRTNESWLGCDLYVMPFHFGTDLATLIRAIEGYVRDPAARLELKPRARLP